MRYQKKIKKDSNGKRYITSGALNIPRLNVSDYYVEVTTTDRLDVLAQKYYGDSSLWYVIANANNIGKGTICIHEGTILRIPINPKGTANQGGY